MSATTQPSEDGDNGAYDTLLRMWDEGPQNPEAAGPPALSQAPLHPLHAPRDDEWPSEANVAEELRPLWRFHSGRASAMGCYCSQLSFSAAEHPAAVLHSILDQGCGSFYVGATTDPIRRWLGDTGMRMLGLGSGDGDGRMLRGHFETRTCMKVVGLFNGATARHQEASLIAYGKEIWHEGCRNVVCDARGISAHTPAFIYIVCQ